jgi:hypothetical protein
MAFTLLTPTELSTSLVDAGGVTLSRDSDAIFSASQKTLLIARFARTVTQLASNTNKSRAFGMFLLFLADNGGSQDAASSHYLIITATDAAGAVTEDNSAVTYTDIIDDLSHFTWYTNRRCLNSYPEHVTRMLMHRGSITNWGRNNYMPARFLEYSYPGAEFHPDVSDAALKALSAAKHFALTRLSGADSTLYYDQHAVGGDGTGERF